MDTYSTGDLARLVGLSVPTVHRAVARLGIAGSATPGGHLRFDEKAAAALVEAVGATPIIDGYTRQDLLVLRALSLAPLGMRSRRAVGRAARVSPTGASDALVRLVAAGLVSCRHAMFAEGVATEGELWRLEGKEAASGRLVRWRFGGIDLACDVFKQCADARSFIAFDIVMDLTFGVPADGRFGHELQPTTNTNRRTVGSTSCLPTRPMFATMSDR